MTSHERKMEELGYGLANMSQELKNQKAFVANIRKQAHENEEIIINEYPCDDIFFAA